MDIQSLFKNIDCKCEELKQAILGRTVLRVIKNKVIFLNLEGSAVVCVCMCVAFFGREGKFTKPSYSMKWLVVFLKELVSISNENSNISSDLQD